MFFQGDSPMLYLPLIYWLRGGGGLGMGIGVRGAAFLCEFILCELNNYSSIAYILRLNSAICSSEIIIFV